MGKSEQSGRRLWEAELERVNQALRLMSRTNKTLNQADDVVIWLTGVCQTAVDVGTYKSAWVGFAEHDKQKTVRMVASAGREPRHLKTLTVTWADEPRGRGPSGTAIRTGRTCIARDIRDDPAFDPWRKEIAKLGFKSSIALPLTSDGRTFGVLSMYADVTNAFGPREVEVLHELAGDLAFGLKVVLRSRAERQLALQELEQSQRSLQAKNVALQEVLASIQAEQSRIGRQIATNVQKIVLPLLHSLRQSLSHKQQRRLEQVERALQEIASPFIDKVSRAVASLTPMELRICDFVRQGLAVKEIAQLEHLSPKTIAAHRRGIRRKLGISNKKINLTSYLQTLVAETPAHKTKPID